MNDSATIAAELEALLAALIDAHESMLGSLARQREGVRRADPDAIGAEVEAQRRAAGAIADLEGDRRALVARAFRGRSAGAPTLSALASSLPGASRERCVELALRLRARVEEVARQSGVVRQAAGTLLGHAQGIMAGVGRRLGGAGTYSGRRGPAGAGGWGGARLATIDVVH